MVRVRVSGVALDSLTNMPIIILKDSANRSLPIWVGIFEAQSILFALEGVKAPRPLTHDLLKNVVENLGAELREVVITGLYNNTYYAKIVIKLDGKLTEIDSRPSDAIALALRTSSPIFVAESVFSGNLPPPDPINDEEVARFKEELKNLRPEDLL